MRRASRRRGIDHPLVGAADSFPNGEGAERGTRRADSREQKGDHNQNPRRGHPLGGTLQGPYTLSQLQVAGFAQSDDLPWA